MKRRSFFFAVLLAALGLAAEETSSSAAPRPPNIVFIFSDDHALKAISAYKGALIKTPNIDRLAAMGTVFDRSYCANSICGPSRACVLTGKHSHKNGYLKNDGQAPFDGKQFTFPQSLQQAGYQTALFGKWHLDSDPTGFDTWCIYPGQGWYYNPQYYGRNPQGEIKRQKEIGYSTDLTTEKSLDWLKQRDPKKPFLLMCQHKAPHRTFMPAPRHYKLYADTVFPEPLTLFDDYSGRSSVLGKNTMSIDRDFQWEYDLKVHGGLPAGRPGQLKKKDSEIERMTAEQKAEWLALFRAENEDLLGNPPQGRDLVRWQYQRYLRNYMRTVAAVDESVGQILDYLQAEGLTENTIIVYSSDQGFYLGEHGWFDKRWMFEESFSMPLIMSWPGVTKPGSRCQKMVQNIDYAPTFLDAAGLAVPAEVQGRSLRPILLDDKAPWRDSLYYHYYEDGGEHTVPFHEGVAGSRYKLINFYADGEINLFDLEKDPQELKSVHDDPAYAEVLKEMKAKLEALRTQYQLPERPTRGKKSK
ncbi:MAG: Arylsulfatase [Verrucomicrobiota bacterium]|jgi:N-acetylglucosamine-6-sulfatase